MSVEYSFSFVYDPDNKISVTRQSPDDVQYSEVAEQFFKFLSAAYGYEITAKDVIDADLSDS